MHTAFDQLFLRDMAVESVSEMTTRKVLILYNSSWYVFLLRRNLIRALKEHGLEITVLAPHDAYSDRVQALGVTHLPLEMSARGTHPLRELNTLISLERAIRYTKPDAVLSFTVKCNLYAGLCKRNNSFRHVANISGLGEGFQENGLLQRALKNLYAIALARTETIFFQNPDDFTHCITSSMVPLSSSALLPGSGVDLSAFNPKAFPGFRRNPSKKVFLMFGRLLPRKGFYSFMNAARTLRQRWGDDVSFWVMGAPDHDRPESGELLEAIIRAHAEGYIRYLQATDDVLPILREASVVVLPSTYNEGVPRSLLEALAMEKPIITTDWKGCRETVRHGVNGYLCRPHDENSLISCLESLITASPERLTEMGRASRALAEERFDEQLVIDAYLDALSPILETRLTRPDTAASRRLSISGTISP